MIAFIKISLSICTYYIPFNAHFFTFYFYVTLLRLTLTSRRFHNFWLCLSAKPDTISAMENRFYIISCWCSRTRKSNFLLLWCEFHIRNRNAAGVIRSNAKCANRYWTDHIILGLCANGIIYGINSRVAIVCFILDDTPPDMGVYII